MTTPKPTATIPYQQSSRRYWFIAQRVRDAALSAVVYALLQHTPNRLSDIMVIREARKPEVRLIASLIRHPKLTLCRLESSRQFIS